MVTLKSELIAKESDILGYTSYVFKNLEEAPFGYNYILTVRFPNWDHREIDIGERGYMTYNEVVAGRDTWWDGTQNIPYSYSNLIFIKFVKEIDNSNKDIII